MTLPTAITNWPPETRASVAAAILDAALPTPERAIVGPHDTVLDFLTERLSPAFPLLKSIYGIDAEPAAERKARKPRKPTLATVAKQASKAAIDVARYEVKPDGTVVIVTGTPESTAADNPWPLDEFRTKETKQ
jgi:hypothetical protein